MKSTNFFCFCTIHFIFLVISCILDIVIYSRNFFGLFNFLLSFSFNVRNFFLFLIMSSASLLFTSFAITNRLFLSLLMAWKCRFPTLISVTWKMSTTTFSCSSPFMFSGSTTSLMNSLRVYCSWLVIIGSRSITLPWILISGSYLKIFTSF